VKILENKNGLEDVLDHNLTELNKIKGMKLVNFHKKDLNSLKQFSFTFISPDISKIKQTHSIFLNAHSINFKKQDNKLDNVFTSVDVDAIIGKKLMEYEDWHTERLVDTGNLTGPQYNLTLTFEDGYYIEIWNYK
jgi:hypothetical protein